MLRYAAYLIVFISAVFLFLFFGALEPLEGMQYAIGVVASAILVSVALTGVIAGYAANTVNMTTPSATCFMVAGLACFALIGVATWASMSSVAAGATAAASVFALLATAYALLVLMDVLSSLERLRKKQKRTSGE